MGVKERLVRTSMNMKIIINWSQAFLFLITHIELSIAISKKGKKSDSTHIDSNA